MFFLQIAICGWAVRCDGSGDASGVTDGCTGTIKVLSCRFAYVFFQIAICGWAVRAEGNGGRGGLRRVCCGTINVLSCSFMRDLGGWYVIV